MGTRVFVNYRRDDSAAEAARVYEAINEEFGDGEVFMDVSSISPGAKWPESIVSHLEESDIVVVVIGPRWFTAGIDDFGKRRIDRDDDWVRLEIESALSAGKLVIPTLVSSAKSPPAEALPKSIQELAKLQKLDIRNEYWKHDIQLLLRQIDAENKIDTEHKHSYNIYPKPPKGGSTAVALEEDQLKIAIQNSIPKWAIQKGCMEDSDNWACTEIYRRYTFKSFISAIDFMHKVAPGCDIAIHHPRWENTWKSLTVWLTTWDIRNKVTDRDIQLAKYLDSAYEEFDGRDLFKQ